MAGFGSVLARKRGQTAETSPLCVVMVGPQLSAHGGIAAVASALVRGVPAVSTDTHVAYLPLTVGRNHSFAAKGWTALAAYTRVAYLATTRASIVHVHVSQGLDFWRSVPILLVARSMRLKVVIHVHPPRAFSGFVRHGPRLLSQVKRRIVGLADALVATCPSGGQELRELFPHSRVEIIENMVELPTRAYVPLTKREAHAVFLGWLIPEKGVYDLLEAFRQVRAVVPEATLAMYGPYGRGSLLRAAARLEIAEAVAVEDWISGGEKAALLSTSRVLVLPSYTEGMPVVIAECMAAGLPVVVTPVGGIPDVIVDGESGIHVAPGDVEQLAAAIERLLTDDDLWERMSKECLRLAPRFNAVAACRRTAQLYHELVEAP